MDYAFGQSRDLPWTAFGSIFDSCSRRRGNSRLQANYPRFQENRITLKDNWRYAKKSFCWSQWERVW
jgi:hypothetical protein